MTDRKVTIKDIELHTETGRNPQSLRRLYIQFFVGDTVRQTPTVEEKDPTHWDQDLSLDAVNTSTLLIRVYQKNRFMKHDELIGALTHTIEEITGKLNNGVFEEHLREDTSDVSDLTDITIKFTFVPPPRDPLMVVESTRIILSHRLSKIATNIAACHLHASMASSVMSSAMNVLMNQENHDEHIMRLVGTMKDVFAFVDEAELLKKIKNYKKVIILLQQVTECGYFIIDYTKSNSWIYTTKYAIFDIDKLIKAYESKLRELREESLEDGTLQTETSVVHMVDVVQNIAAGSIDLRDIPYAEAKYSQEKGCLPGTRESLLREICDVLNNPAEEAPRVYLLCGIAGSGKSAVAHSIARLYDGQKRLASSYFFAGDDVERRNPRNLFSTIARDLCDHDPQYRSALWRTLKDDRTLRMSISPLEQLERFIVKPIGKLDSIGPQMVVIIDALDGSGDPANRQELLEAISKQITDNVLPKNLRFLITTRPESDILAKLPASSRVVHKRMEDVPEKVVDGDIERFIHNSLDRFPELESSQPHLEWCRVLVRRSHHLFRSAAIACEFIQAGANPLWRFDLLLQGDGSVPVPSLDQLYQAALGSLFPSHDTQQSFRDVMAVILSLCEPLPLASFSVLFYSNEDHSVQHILTAMGLLLDGVLDKNGLVHPPDLSFRNFLTNEARSSTFHVDDLLLYSPHLGRALLACMQDNLRFNICGLKDSRLPNSAVLNLHDWVEMAIPPHLSYSCQYWMDYLKHTACTPGLLKEVTDFFKKCFPYWLEAISLLSLTSQFPIQSAEVACTTLCIWAKGQEVATLASEASHFIQVFSPILQGSTPHLYLSAMPQTPPNSPLCKLWADHLQKHVFMISGHLASWPIKVYSLQAHTDCVTCVAYSPDGRYIVSGSKDKTIKIWEATTGKMVKGPLQGHTKSVSSIAYSPDSKHIVSGSLDKTIRIWDAITGDPVAGPFEGHTLSVNSVAYSPDKKHIVSGSEDKTIRVWDITPSGIVLGPLFHGHTKSVSSVAYSPDGSWIVSGSEDRTIRVWDVTTGITVASLLKGHTQGISSVAYSPDGKHIVSGSLDKTIWIWDATTGESVAGPFQGHTDYVTSVVYSSDGKYIISGSWDNTVRIWNPNTVKIVAGPFKKHTQGVYSVAFSPDGRHIASGSEDKTINVWDVTISEPMTDPFQGHEDSITSVTYSFDGKYIVSGSKDMTIRVWDAITGEARTSPFEGHTSSVNSIAYSPNKDHIVSGSEDMTIRVWNATTGEIVAGPFQGHEDGVTSVDYSIDGKHIISGSKDKTIRVWDAITGEARGSPFEGHTSSVNSVSYSPDGNLIVSGSEDKTIIVWNAITGDIVAGPFKGHTKPIHSVAYSPDGMHIVSGSEDKTIRVWDAETGGIVAGIFKSGHMQGIYSVAYSPNGKNIVSSSLDKTVRVWDATTGEIVAGPFKGNTQGVYSVTYSPDGKHIVFGSEDNIIRVWNIWSAAAEKNVTGLSEGNTSLVESIAYSPDGKHIASGSLDKTIRIWDATTGKIVTALLQGHTKDVSSIAYSSDNKHIVSGSLDKTIRVWNVTFGGVVAGPFEGHTLSVNSVAYSPDERHVVSGSSDKTVRVWDVTTNGTVVAVFQGHTKSVNSVVYSPDGRYIASGSEDKTIRVWDATSMAGAAPFKGHTQGVYSVSYSPDGRNIVSGSWDKTIRIWDPITGETVAGPFKGHSQGVNSVAYSPNGEYIVSGSVDNTIRVWDVTTGQTVAGPFEGHTSLVNSVAYSPDGTHIVSGSFDQSIRVWDIQSFQSFESPQSISLVDGWIEASNNNVFGWVAPWNRHLHLFPFHSLIISSHGIYQVNVDSSLFGESWISCWKH